MTPDTHTMFIDSDEPANFDALGPAREDVALAVLLDQDTMLIAGKTGDAVPEAAEALFADDVARRGAWRAFTWAPSRGRAEGRHFIGVLWVSDIVRLQSMRTTLDAGPDGRGDLPEIGRVELDAAPLFARLHDTGADLAAVFDFLRRALLAPPAGAPSHRIRRFLLSFLDGISKHDGFVEMLGNPDCGGLLLQGWSVHLQPGALDLAVLGPGFEFEPAVAASFERPDLLATARGIVAFAKDASADDLKALQRVYFRADEGYFHLDVVDSSIILGAPESVAQLKTMLGKIDADPATIRAFKRVCRVRFPGHETVSALTQPVRMACDVALHADGAGIFVSGWLLDPQGLASMVLLKSTRGFYARLHDNWARLPRRDVTEGFAADPLFVDQLRADDAYHGFLAFVPRPDALAPGEEHYLEIVLEDESCAFAPIRFDAAEPGQALRRVLGSVNIDEPAIDSIVSAHLGPIAAALSARRLAPAAIKARIAFGPAVERPEVAIVVPLLKPRPDFDVNLARFAGDPDFRRAELVVVAPRAQAEPVAALLRRTGPFYGLGGTLIIVDGSIDYFDALELGAQAASAELVLFLAPSVLPTGRGWLARLVEALRQTPQAGMISPTLLYEDDSVRFAGSAEVGADPIAATTRFAGYSHHWLKATEVAPVWAGTAECALISRRLFLGSGGFAREFVGPDLKSLDFALRLGAQGARSYWAPEISLYALDDAEVAEDDYWRRVGHLVDRCAFESKWSAALAVAARE